MEEFLRFLENDNLVIFGVMVFSVGLWEILRPATVIPKKHYGRNFLYGLSFLFLIILTAPLFAYLTTSLVRMVSPGWFDLRSLAWSPLIVLVVSSLISDFFQYWYHRLRHQKILWRTHLLHHSDEYMNVTTYARGHITEIVFEPLLIALPIALLFQLPPQTVAVVSLLPRMWEYFTHANLNIGFGPLWWMLTSPNYHRIHHSIEAKHRDKNFSTWFPIWDVIFRTAWQPRKDERPQTGVENIHPRSLWQMHMLPFH